MMMGSVAPSGVSALADLTLGWMWLMRELEADQLVHAVDRFAEKFERQPDAICMNQQTFDAMFNDEVEWSGFCLAVISWVPDQHIWMPLAERIQDE